MKITRDHLRQIIKEELADRFSSVEEGYTLREQSEPEIQESFDDAEKFPANTLRVSENGIREIKLGEGFRPRIYDDKIRTDETAGPFIMSFGWDPWSGERIEDDPVSGRLGSENFDITSFNGTTRMSKTNGVPTIGYGIALNSSERIRDYAHFLSDIPGQAEQWVTPAARDVDEDEESWQGGNENRIRRDMTEAEADALLREIVETEWVYARAVRHKLGSTLITQDQFDALVSRAWNEGSEGDTILAAVEELQKGTPEGWLAARDAGRFTEDGPRQRRERALMSSWI